MIFNNPKLRATELPTFYKEFIKSFKKANCVMKPTISCKNEALSIPLWKFVVITGSNKLLNSKVLPPAGITILDQIVNNGSLISVNELANKSKIKPINAGKDTVWTKQKH